LHGGCNRPAAYSPIRFSMPSCLQHWLLFSSRPGLSVVPANNSKIPTNMQPKTTDRSAAVQHRLLTGVLVAAAVTLSVCSSSDNASQTPPLPDSQPETPTNLPPQADGSSAAVQQQLPTGVLLAAANTLSVCRRPDPASLMQPIHYYQPDPVSVDEAASKVAPAELRFRLKLEDDT